jgi:DNA-binding CsgD family transcriptional regulator
VFEAHRRIIAPGGPPPAISSGWRNLVATPSDTLDRIARSGEAVFAIDSADRIILWNKKCEELLQRTSRSVLGKPCHDVIGGRDASGNIYCYRNCPVAHQSRQLQTADPVRKFPLSVKVGDDMKWFSMSMFAIPSYHPALSTVVHVVRPSESGPESRLERSLSKEASDVEPLWPMTTAEGEPVDLTSREKEILRCLAQGLSTPAIAKKLFIAPVTVRNHVQSILHKLDVHTKLAAVVFAYRHNLI